MAADGNANSANGCATRLINTKSRLAAANRIAISITNFLITLIERFLNMQCTAFDKAKAIKCIDKIHMTE